MIASLRGKLIYTDNTSAVIEFKAVGHASVNSNSMEAVAALVSLGYTQSEASLAVGRQDQSLSTEELIKLALKTLARGL